MLRHLYEIAQGKQCSLPKETPRSLALSESLQHKSRQSFNYQLKCEARRIDSANLRLMERIVGSAGTLDSQGMDKTFRRAQEFKLRHARKTSVELASRLIERSSRLKNSVMTTYMLPSIDSASAT